MSADRRPMLLIGPDDMLVRFSILRTAIRAARAAGWPTEKLQELALEGIEFNSTEELLEWLDETFDVRRLR